MIAKIPLIALCVLLAPSPLMAQEEMSEAAREAIAAATDAAEAAEAGLQDIEASELTEPLPITDQSLPMPLDVAKWHFRSADYPAELWEDGPEALVAYSAEINADGRPVSCTITESTGIERLDELTCEIVMRRGKFTPAQDEEGVPVAGTFVDSHYWSKREAPFNGSFTIHVAFTIDATGSVSDCEVIEQSGALDSNMARAFEREPCPGMNRGYRAPFRDENGNPVAKRVTLLMDLALDDD